MTQIELFTILADKMKLRMADILPTSNTSSQHLMIHRSIHIDWIVIYLDTSLNVYTK